MSIWKSVIMAYLGGMMYVAIELLWRGWSHPSMFLLGGLCFLVIGSLNQGILPRDMPLPVQAVLGALCVTALELACGVLVNIILGLGVWDYSHLPMNFHGQICLYFFLLWIPLSGLAVWVNDLLRHLLFGEVMPKYRWW